MQRICSPTLQQLPDEAPQNRIPRSPLQLQSTWKHRCCDRTGSGGTLENWTHLDLIAPLPTAPAHLPGELLRKEYKSDLTDITGAHMQVTRTLAPCWLLLLGYSLYPHPTVPLPCLGYSPASTLWCASAIPWVSCQPSPPLQMEMHKKLSHLPR